MKKKICIITTVDITLREFVIPSAREMKKNGFDVTFVSSFNNSFTENYSNEFKLVNMPFERGVNFYALLKSILVLSSFIRKEKFDIIQYATPNASFYASIAGFINKVPARIYCQWGIRYVGFSGFTKTLFKYIEKITCILSTHIRPASLKNMQFGIDEKLYKSSKAKVIGAGGAVGINLDVFNINEKLNFRREILLRHPELKEKLIFGFVGRLDKDKGINELIKAFKLFSEKNRKAFLLIVGPSEKSTNLDQELIEYSINSENILFTGYSNEINKYISSMDILIHPSYREGFSLVIQQAMAMGVPVITTDIPGPSEVIEENISGLLVPSKDYLALNRAMNELSKDKEKQILFGNNGLKRVEKLFTQQIMSKLIVEDRQHIYEITSIKFKKHKT